MIQKNLIKTFAVVFAISSCAASPPENPDNICSIFNEKRSWYKAAIKTEKRWKLPPYVLMSFIYQESVLNQMLNQKERQCWGLFHGKGPRLLKVSSSNPNMGGL